MAILLLAEHDNHALSEQTSKALTAAFALSNEVDILICGHEAQNIAKQAAQYQNIRKVLLADAAHLAHGLAENVSATIMNLADDYDIFIAPATSNGKNIMPRVAAMLDVMQLSDISAVIDKDIFQRPIYAGNALETVQALDAKKVITVRTTSFAKAALGGDAEIVTITPARDQALSQFIGEEQANNDRPELTAARIVVSGGRALGSAEQFMDMLNPLAEKLQAALGASRAAVDAGYAPNDWQVGQTGKVVAPDLYIAVGISGAIQHLAGMKDSKVIVAINKDEEAPIMQIADYALQGDLFDLIPKLQKAIA